MVEDEVLVKVAANVAPSASRVSSASDTPLSRTSGVAGATRGSLRTEVDGWLRNAVRTATATSRAAIAVAASRLFIGILRTLARSPNDTRVQRRGDGLRALRQLQPVRGSQWLACSATIFHLSAFLTSVIV